jgi:serine phosphatase RsbU (regulator of sigma subunit)
MIAVLNALSEGDTSVDVQTRGNDEVGRLAATVSSFRRSLIEKDQALAHNVELQRDNLRMGAELDVTQRLQEMVLPSAAELGSVAGLDIAAHMEPAEEVGGDYYDVLQSDGRIKIAIGDVTGHGLESGVMMLMAQTAVRTLFTHEERLPKKFFGSLNRTLFDNMQRMQSDKNLTLSLIDYYDGEVLLSGQHEEVIVVKEDCSHEVLDTIDLGFPIALEPDIDEFINEHRFTLNEGDGFVLFTDGITEAENRNGQQFGMERLCCLLKKHWNQPAEGIKESVLAELKEFIGAHVVHDDITLVIVKKDIASC